MNEKEKLYLEVIKMYQSIMADHITMVVQITKIMNEGFSALSIYAIMFQTEEDVRVKHNAIELIMRQIKADTLNASLDTFKGIENKEN